MKVLQICHDFPPSLGGGATHVHRLSTELAKLGHGVTVFTTDLTGANERSRCYSEQMGSVFVRRFYATRVPFLGEDIGYIPLGMVPAVLSPFSFDIVHVHTYRFFSTWLAPIIHVFKSQIPIVMTAHSAREPYRPLRIRLFDLIWGRQIFNAATRVIALTNIEKQNLAFLGCDLSKVSIIPNGVDPFALDYQPNIRGFRERFHITQSRIVLFVGRIRFGKGVDILIDAIPQVLADIGDDVTFLLVGPDWGDRQAFEERARSLGVASKVVFTGPLVGDALLDAYYSADVFALLSRFEAAPVVLFEAMGAAKPVVATRVGLIQDIVQEDVNGLLVESEDVRAAAVAISKLLSDNRLAKQLGQAGKSLVLERYRWDLIANQVAALYTECLR